MLLATTTPTARLVAFTMVASAKPSAMLVTSAVMLASLRAETETSPAESMCEFVMYAYVSAGDWLPKALEMSGSPRIASIVLKRKLGESQPTRLNAIDSA